MGVCVCVEVRNPAPISEELGRLLVQKVYKAKVRKSQCPAALLTSVPHTAAVHNQR